MIKFTLFFLSLSLLIILHEFGHYITARWFKAKVDKFYLFFDFLFPFPGVMKFSLFKKKIGDTEYGIGWFPFGGYVDIAGMMADPEDKEQKAPEPHEFRGKKPWQRLIILAGGITVKIKYADFTLKTRAAKLEEPALDTGAIFDAARALLPRFPDLGRRGVRLTGISAHYLVADGTPTTLFPDAKIARGTQLE